MERRKFLAVTGLSIFAASISGCGLVNSKGVYTGCDPTTSDMLGPYFKRKVPFNTDLTYPDSKDEVKIKVAGKVFGTDCEKPLQNVVINIWHCDHKKKYDMVGNKCRGKFKTTLDGAYGFSTFIPPPYASGPKHIHYLVEVNGYEQLITQLYFKGDIYFEGYKKVKQRKWRKFQWDEKRILQPYKNAQGDLEVTLDLYLTKE